MSLLDDITSKDPARIWSSSCAIRTLRDRRELDALASHLDLIRERTKAISLGGALRPNSSHLEFALKKLEFVKNSDQCLCCLYLQDDLCNPLTEEQEGNIHILGTTRLDGGRIDHYQCKCILCGTIYRVEEREYHYSWWAWQRA